MEINLIKELWSHIGKKRRRQFYSLFILICIGSLFEFVSIGLLIPFITVISNPKAIFQNEYASSIISHLNITSEN